MEKLIELLNEYEKSTGIVFNIWTKEWTLHYYDNYKDENIYDNVRLLIISKEYWFIKRLVENDKIDRNKLTEKIWKTLFPILKYEELWYWYEIQSEKRFSDYESLLMLLSISDEPIDFLISVLK